VGRTGARGPRGDAPTYISAVATSTTTPNQLIGGYYAMYIDVPNVPILWASQGIIVTGVTASIVGFDYSEGVYTVFFKLVEGPINNTQFSIYYTYIQ
jgi:hypothetical protein